MKCKLKTSIKKFLISFCLTIAIVFQFAFLSYLYKNLISSDKSKIIMNYSQNNIFDYKVYLKNNDFIDQEYLEKDEAYILDLIDHVHVTSIYNFNATEKTNVKVDNKVVAKLKVNFKDSSSIDNEPEILNKEEVLKEDTIKFNASKKTNVNSFDIKLDDYIKIVEDFKTQTKIPVTAYVEISSKSNLEGKVGGAVYKDKYERAIKVPITSSVIKIEDQGSKKEGKVTESALVKTNKKVLTFIILGNVITFIIICMLLKKLFSYTNKTEYQKELEKILRNYDDIIVNTASIIDVNKYKVIKIEEFKELLNLSRELLLPIMNYEVKKNEETCFYIIKDDILYMYLIYDKTSSKFKNKKLKK